LPFPSCFSAAESNASVPICVSVLATAPRTVRGQLMGAGIQAASESPLLTLGIAVLWIPGIFFLIGALIWLFVGSRMRLGGQVAARAAPVRCAQVRIGDPPVHLNGLTAPGPRGLLTAPVSGVQCVWYRARLFRIYQSSLWQNTSEGWEPVAAPAGSGSGKAGRARSCCTTSRAACWSTRC